MNLEGSSYKSDDLLFELVHKPKDMDSLVKFYAEKHSSMALLHHSIFLHKLNKQLKQQPPDELNLTERQRIAGTYRSVCQYLIDNYKNLDPKSLSRTLSVFAFSDSEAKRSFAPTQDMLSKIELMINTNMAEYMQSDSLANALVAFLRLGYQPNEMVW